MKRDNKGAVLIEVLVGLFITSLVLTSDTLIVV